MSKRIKQILSELFFLANKTMMWLPLTIIRIWWLRIIGCKIGKHVYIGRNVEVRKPQNILINNNSIVNANVLLDGRGGVSICRTTC